MNRHSIPADLFDVLCQIGEVASIMQDVAAREIGEGKPIAGTAIDMLAKLIAGHVNRGMEFTPDRAVDAPTAPQTSAPGGVGTWPGGLDLHNLHTALAGSVACLCALQRMADDTQIDADAFEPILDCLTPWRDRALAARDILETGSVARHSEAA
ncbi:hypothetical protein [Acidiphilium rubrum]|uniref:hypothetical protein n=1 Tax=Acidiphilium rubrum TaxID=526 RepID=UPI002C5B74B6|nr:hypothetical protein [Acidiphilium rubrum]HQT86533.1 hypothetical protein [Acidiphilium rubrum]